uniref:Uncharacterized protein n=2 Tax=Entamoeba invadens TaxID=33085 RepID=S0B4T1_ENTIV|nr:hypothetical protein [Entamoeba invadens]
MDPQLWVNEDVDKYVRFSINNKIIEVPEIYTSNDRADCTIMKMITARFQDQIKNNQVIELRGGKREEKSFRVYLNFLEGKRVVEEQLSVRQMAKKVATLLQFGVSIQSSLKMIGLQVKEDIDVVIGTFLIMMNERTLDLVLIMDTKQGWRQWMYDGLVYAAQHHREAFFSNAKVLEALCVFYNMTELISYLIADSYEEKNKLFDINTEEVFQPLVIKSDVVIKIGGGRVFN